MHPARRKLTEIDRNKVLPMLLHVYTHATEWCLELWRIKGKFERDRNDIESVRNTVANDIDTWQ